jgi:hypothetical protein
MKLNKSITVKDYFCLSTNPNLLVLNPDKVDVNVAVKTGGGSWWNWNKTELDADGYLIYDPYGKPLSDIILPETDKNKLNDYNPYKINDRRHSYQQIKNLDNFFKSYHDYLYYLCRECTKGIEDNIEDYINLTDQYRYFDGDKLYPFVHFLATSTPDEKHYYFKSNVNKTFLDYALDQFKNNSVSLFGVSIGDWTVASLTGARLSVVLEDEILTRIDVNYGGRGYSTLRLSIGGDAVIEPVIVDGSVDEVLIIYNGLRYSSTPAITLNDGDNVKGFMKEYIYSTEKINLLSNLIYWKVYSILYPDDGEDEIMDIVQTALSDYAVAYYKLNTDCNPVPLIAPQYKISDFTAESTLKFNVMLTGEIEDLGILTPAVEVWVSGREYRKGDVVMYEGVSYILLNTATYSGYYHEKENKIYFDDVNIDSGTGYATGLKFDVNGDLPHWKRNVKNSTGTGAAKKTNIHALTDSQLETLKAFRKETGNINFFDTEGLYKENLDFGISYISQNEYYRSRIKDIEKGSNSTGTHEWVTYTYVIDELWNGTSVVAKGITHIETYNRYKMNNNRWRYEIEPVSDIDYEKEYFAPELYEGENGKKYPAVYPEALAKIYNYYPLAREEYLNGIVMKPRVEDNVSIDRQINYCMDKHLVLGECRTLNQLLSYHNGSFYNFKRD